MPPTPKAKPLCTADREAGLQVHIEEFVVNKLKGRYREHVSDRFLSCLLTKDCREVVYWPQTGKEFMDHPFDRRGQIAYDKGCPIFELILESQCGAGGNGHHVAQDFSAHMKLLASKFKAPKDKPKLGPITPLKPSAS